MKPARGQVPDIQAGGGRLISRIERIEKDLFT